MKIREIEIYAFGRLENRRFSFGDGMNLIHGENEAGKSTLQAFLRAMLFGMERGRGRASREDAYTRFRPWKNPGRYGGRMDLEIGGKCYRLIRDFTVDPRDLSVYDMTTGEEVPDFEERFLHPTGLNESNYRNAMLIVAEQGPSREELAAGLGDKLVHMATGGDRELAASQAIARLHTRYRQIEKKLPIARLRELEARKHQVSSWEEERQELQQRLREIEDDRRTVQISDSRDVRRAMEIPDRRDVRSAVPGQECPVRKPGTQILVIVSLLALGLLLFLVLRQHQPPEVAILASATMLLLAVLYGLLSGRKRKQQSRQLREEQEAERAEQLVEQGRLLARIEQLEKQLDAEATLDQDYQELRAEISRQQEEMHVLATAMELLQQVSSEVKQGFGTAFAEEMERALGEITAGDHGKLYLDEDFRIRLEEDGQIQPLERFSRGTVAQTNLIMSLAAGRLLFRESIPLLLDDALVHYDTGRLQAALEYLCREHPGQILLCSHSDREAECLEEAGIPYRYLNLVEELKD